VLFSFAFFKQTLNFGCVHVSAHPLEYKNLVSAVRLNSSVDFLSYTILFIFTIDQTRDIVYVCNESVYTYVGSYTQSFMIVGKAPVTVWI
jgi:hypothetical protein